MQNNSRPVFLFITLVFLFSIPFWILSAVHPIQLLPGLPLSALQAFVPAITALFLVYRGSHSSGAFQLLRRAFDFKRIKKWTWYIPIILINPIVAILAYLLLKATDQSIPEPAPLTLAVFPLLLIFFIPALGEELGWSGHATEPLLSGWGIIPTGMFLGIVWAVWHFIPLLQVDRPIAWIAWWSFGTVCLRMVMVWLYASSGKSVFGTSMFHAMTNLCWQLFPVNGSHYDPRVFSLIMFVFMVLIIVVGYFLPASKTQAPSVNA